MLCCVQRLLAEISQIVPQMEQLKRHLQDASVSLSPEEKAELEEKVKDMEKRLTGLQEATEVNALESGFGVSLGNNSDIVLITLESPTAVLQY